MHTNRWDHERAVTASNLPAPSRLLLLVLAIRADATTGIIPAEFSPSHAALAADTGLSKRTVVDHLAAVEKAGWLRVKRAPVAQQRADHTPNQYRLALPKTAEKLVQELHPEPAKASATAAPPPTRASAAPAPGLVQELHGASAGAAPNQTNYTTKNNQAPSGASRTSASAPAPTRTRTALEHLNATAVQPDAYTLVSAWAQTLEPPLLRDDQHPIAKAVNDLLREGAQPHILREALNDWTIRGRTIGFLRNCYQDAAQAARTATTTDVRGSRVGPQARPSTTDQRVLAARALQAEMRQAGLLDDYDPAIAAAERRRAALLRPYADDAPALRALPEGVAS
jgi:hypothetical protein